MQLVTSIGSGWLPAGPAGQRLHTVICMSDSELFIVLLAKAYKLKNMASMEYHLVHVTSFGRGTVFRVKFSLGTFESLEQSLCPCRSMYMQLTENIAILDPLFLGPLQILFHSRMPASLIWWKCACCWERGTWVKASSRHDEVSVSLLMWEGIARAAGTCTTETNPAWRRWWPFLLFPDLLLDLVTEGWFKLNFKEPKG